MQLHGNARTTPYIRREMVRRVRERAEPVTETAAALGVSARTVYKWLDRYEREGEAGLLDRSSRPTCCPHATSAGVVRQIDKDQQLTFLLPQPEVDYIVLAPGGLYMFPRSDGVLLGGTHERGMETLDPDPDAKRRILAGHERLFAGRQQQPPSQGGEGLYSILPPQPR